MDSVSSWEWITTEYWLATFICHVDNVVSSYVVKYAHIIPMVHLTSQNIVCYSVISEQESL